MRKATALHHTQRPPWRDTNPLSSGSDEEADVDFHRRLQPPRLREAVPTSERPLRPPPIFQTLPSARHYGDEPHVMQHPAGHASAMDNVLRGRTSLSTASHSSQGSVHPLTATQQPHSRARCPPVDWEAPHDYSQHSAYVQDTQRGSARLREPSETALRVPVTRWRASASLDTHRKAEPEVEKENDGPLHSAAVVEHYHIEELEEQLQYWRRRALVVESRVAQRERVWKDKYAADFAAAQAASEEVIRRLLHKQQKLRRRLVEVEQVQVKQNPHAGGEVGSAAQLSASQVRTASLTSHSFASSFSCATDAGLNHGETPNSARQRKSKGNRQHHRTNRNDVELGHTSADERSSSAASNVSDVRADSGMADSRNAELHNLVGKVAVLTSENARLSNALAAAKQSSKTTPDERRNERIFSPTGGAATNDTAAASVSVEVRRIVSCVQATAQALLRCLESSAELRHCCAAFDADNAQVEDGEADQLHSTSQHGTQVRHHAIAQRLADVLHGEHKNDAASSTEGDGVFSSQAEGQLSCFLDAAQHLDQLLLTCVDDVVLLRSRWEEQQHGVEGVQAALRSLKETHHQREAQCAEQLNNARRTAEEAERQRAIAAQELISANNIISKLKEKLVHCEDALRTETHTRVQTERARSAEVQRVREDLLRDVLEATRRSSAAEHAADISARQEAQWRTQLTAAEARRDAFAEECAVLKGRLEALQTREHITSSGERRQSLPASSSFLTEARQQQRAQLRSSVQAPVSTSMKPTVTGEKAADSPKPHHVRIFDADREDVLDERAEAFSTTPRRSLSYSPPESARRLVPVSARSPSDGSSASSSGLGVRPRSYPDRRAELLSEANVLSSAPRPSSQPSPVNVVQPSILVQGGNLREEPVKAVKKENASASLSADNSSTPLARMRAWEEKFKSILTTS